MKRIFYILIIIFVAVAWPHRVESATTYQSGCNIILSPLRTGYESYSVAYDVTNNESFDIVINHFDIAWTFGGYLWQIRQDTVQRAAYNSDITPASISTNITIPAGQTSEILYHFGNFTTYPGGVTTSFTTTQGCIMSPPLPTATPTATATLLPTATATPLPTFTPTSTLTPTVTATPTPEFETVFRTTSGANVVLERRISYGDVGVTIALLMIVLVNLLRLFYKLILEHLR